MRRCARTKRWTGEAGGDRVCVGRQDVIAFGWVNESYVLRAADDAQQGREGDALPADLERARNAVLIGLQMRIGVRLHAELGDEQHQRQHVDNQATAISDQTSSLRPESIC